jgi:DNA-binding NarL/FixJ family response regulator
MVIATPLEIGIAGYLLRVAGRMNRRIEIESRAVSFSNGPDGGQKWSGPFDPGQSGTRRRVYGERRSSIRIVKSGLRIGTAGDILLLGLANRLGAVLRQFSGILVGVFTRARRGASRGIRTGRGCSETGTSSGNMQRELSRMERNGQRGSAEPKPAALVVSEVLIYREGIAAGLNRLGDIEIVAAVRSVELSAELRARSIRILFVDISNERSRECARTALEIAPDVQVIGFGMTTEDEGLAGAELGVTAFVDHDGTIADLNQAAKRALSGIPVCPPQLTTRLLQRVAQLARRARPKSDAQLTDREREVASLVEEGLSNKEIAGALNISPATVKNHVHIILDKLNLPRRRMVMLERPVTDSEDRSRILAQ